MVKRRTKKATRKLGRPAKLLTKRILKTKRNSKPKEMTGSTLGKITKIRVIDDPATLSANYLRLSKAMLRRIEGKIDLLLAR